MSHLLRFEQVSLRRGGRLLFEGLDLALEAGDALQVTGPNGSGKSSLIRLAAGLLRAERGQVERSDVALADDNFALDPELPLERALRFWGGSASSAMRALGIDHLADVPVRLLSSGQSKRATLARVYVLIDARHGIKDVDLDVLKTLDKSAVSYQVVLTKADQVKAGELKTVTAETIATLAKHPAAFPEVLVTSSRTGDGMPELRAAMVRLIEERRR